MLLSAGFAGSPPAQRGKPRDCTITIWGRGLAENILVIEAEPVVRSTVVRILTREGFKVHSAANTHEALAVTRSIRQLAVVVADERLARAPGLAVLRQLQSVH